MATFTHLITYAGLLTTAQRPFRLFSDRLKLFKSTKAILCMLNEHSGVDGESNNYVNIWT